MKLQKYFIFCVAIILVQAAHAQSPFIPDPKQVEDVHEAVFRYFFTHELAGSVAESFCISSINPLPISFVERFKGSKPPVVWLSACPLDPSNSEPSSKQSERAERVGIMSVRWISNVEVEVRGHVRNGRLGASQQLLHLVRRNGRWSVDGDRTELYS